MEKGRWYRKRPWRSAQVGDIVRIKQRSTSHDGKVVRVVGKDSCDPVYLDITGEYGKDVICDFEDRFDQLEASAMTDPNWPGNTVGYVWGEDFLEATTTEGGNTNTVKYTAGNSWHPPSRGSVVYPTKGDLKRLVCVVTDVHSDDTFTCVSYEDPSRSDTLLARSSSHYSLDKGGRGKYSGPDDARISVILAGNWKSEVTGTNRYSIGPWRKAQVGDIVLDKGSIDGVCEITRLRTLREHTYGQHSRHDVSDSEVVTIKPYGGGNTAERWNDSEAFEILVPAYDGVYVGPNHSTLNNNTGGTLNMDAQPLIIKTPKVIESIQAKLDEKKQVWDDDENARVEKAQGAGKLAAAFAKAHPGLVQFALEYRYGLLFSSHTDVDSVDTWLKAAGYGSEIEQQDAKTVVEPAQEFPGDPTLEKMIRTLSMADNETVEVFPTDAVYSLL
jgi:hypothetical protein